MHAAYGEVGGLVSLSAFYTSIMSNFLKPLTVSIAIAAVFPSLFLSNTAFAQASSTDTTNVNASNQGRNIAPVVLVTASRQPQSAKDVLADNLVITAEDILKSGAVSVVDLLQQQRGIEIARNGGAGTNSSVFIRGGSNAQNVVLVDGVRIGSATTGGASWATIPLSQIERIEVVFGPLSSLYGADALGGVIQIFTKKAAASLAINANAGFGNDGLQKIGAGIGGNQHGWNFSLQAARDQAKGYSATLPALGSSYHPDRDGYVLESMSARAAYQLQTNINLGANVIHSRLNAQFDAGPKKDDRNIQKLDTVALFAEIKHSSHWQSRAQISQAKDDGFTDASYGKSYILTTQNTSNWQTDARLDHGALQMFIERRKEEVESTTAALRRQRSTNSAAISYITKLDSHHASLSVRHDNSSQYGANTNGSAAYGYHIAPQLRLNASIGTSFRAPTFNELYYPSYGVSSNKPERARNAEVGVYYEENQLQWSASYYQNKVKDLLVSTNVCPVERDTHAYGCAYNVNKATMSGLTIAGTWQLDALKLRGTVDLQDPRDDTTGLRLARRSKQHGNLSAEYRIAQTNFGIEAHLSGDRFDDQPNKKRLAGYALTNLFVKHQFDPKWALLARWNNVANKKYELVKNYATAGSNVFVGINYGQ